MFSKIFRTIIVDQVKSQIIDKVKDQIIPSHKDEPVQPAHILPPENYKPFPSPIENIVAPSEKNNIPEKRNDFFKTLKNIIMSLMYMTIGATIMFFIK